MKLQSKLNVIFILLLILSISLACEFTDESSNSGTNEQTAAGDEAKSESDDDTTLTMEDGDEDASEDDEETSTVRPKTNSKQTTVKFGRGKTSRGYKNSVIRGESHTYYIGASKGQRMTINIKSLEDNADFVVISPLGGYPIAGTEENGIISFNEILEDNGKYKVIVTPTRGNATFNINFAVSAKEKVDPPDDSGGGGGGGITKVVKFGKGRTGASYSGAVIRAEADTYILGASAGQVMSVSVSSLENNAVFSITTPTGSLLASERSSWSGQLPANGKYRIVVSGTRGNATYKINFAVR